MLVKFVVNGEVNLEVQIYSNMMISHEVKAIYLPLKIFVHYSMQEVGLAKNF
jgi:hypothetical protein